MTDQTNVHDRQPSDADALARLCREQTAEIDRLLAERDALAAQVKRLADHVDESDQVAADAILDAKASEALAQERDALAAHVERLREALRISCEDRVWVTGAIDPIKWGQIDIAAVPPYMVEKYFASIKSAQALLTSTPAQSLAAVRAEEKAVNPNATTLYARAADVIRRGWDDDDHGRNRCWWCNGVEETNCLDCGMPAGPGGCPVNSVHVLHLATPGADPVHVVGCPVGEVVADLDAAQKVADDVRARAIADCAGWLRVKAACRRRIVCMGPSTLLHQEVAAELEVEAQAIDRLASGTEGGALRLLAEVVSDLRRPEQGELTPWKADLLRRAEAVFVEATEDVPLAAVSSLAHHAHVLEGAADTCEAIGTISEEEARACALAALVLREIYRKWPDVGPIVREEIFGIIENGGSVGSPDRDSGTALSPDPSAR